MSVPSRLSLWAPVVAYMAMLFALSAWQTPPALPVGTDKEVHWLLYCGLSALLVRALARGAWIRVTIGCALAAVVAAAAYGVTDEFHQLYVPGRTADVFDLMADTFGAAAAAFTLWLWGRMKRARGPGL